MTITAKVLADSVGTHGAPRLITLQLRYPKFIHGEFMTHRMFSRNASSSRAIPVERLIRDVIEDPVYPSFWGANQKGMQADAECNVPLQLQAPDDSEFWKDPDNTDAQLRHCAMSRTEAWDEARDRAVHMARTFAKAGYHKQIVNRLLEPFCHINVVVTATHWSNFFALRCHRDAQPEMRMLAEAMRDAIDRSAPRGLVHGWHLPYVYPDEEGDTTTLIKLSVARCARVSYLTQEGKTPSREEDLALYDRLVSSVPLHASPCEHQATPDLRMAGYGRWENPSLHGNLLGWRQYRKTLPGECQ